MQTRYLAAGEDLEEFGDIVAVHHFGFGGVVEGGEDGGVFALGELELSVSWGRFAGWEG